MLDDCTAVRADRSATWAPTPPPVAPTVLGAAPGWVLAPGLVVAGFAAELADGSVLEGLGLGLVADALGDVLALFDTWLFFVGRVTTSRTIAKMATTSRASSTIRTERGPRRPPGGGPDGTSYRATITSAGRVGSPPAVTGPPSHAMTSPSRPRRAPPDCLAFRASPSVAGHGCWSLILLIPPLVLV